MNNYIVSFQYSENVYCSNIAIAECKEDVEKHYSNYAWVKVSDASEYDLEEAKAKGKPIITIEHQEPTENATEATETAEKNTSYTIIDNEQYNSKEVYFNGIPSKEIREALKGLKFRWNNKKMCWYGFASEEEINTACSGSEIVEIPRFEKVEAGTMYEGWKGGKAGTWHDDKELKTLIMADLKKAGIKATIRFNNAGYLTSFILTITLGKDAVKTFEEWEKGYNFFNAPFGWVQYMENGTRRDIHREALLTMENEQPEEFKRIIESNKAIRYQDAIDNLSSSNCYFGNGLDILTSDGNAILTAAKEIVDSYNHDQTNSQIDYFDRDIYDHYSIKIA